MCFALAVGAIVQIAFTAMVVLAELQEPDCATKVDMSDLDYVREAWNVGLATMPNIASNDEAAQIIRSNPTCCKVVHVAPRSLWTSLTSTFSGKSAVIVYLTVESSAGKSNATVEFDACGRVAPY